MVFSSHLFLFLYLPAVLLAYYALPRAGRHFGLVLASYAFYGWANPAFMLLMAASTAIDYICGLVIAESGVFSRRPPERLAPGARSRRQRTAVAVSVIANLGLLATFKYANFAIDSFRALAAWFGLDGAVSMDVIRIALPLGISFYTFQSMSYTIDVYRGHATALRNPIDFATYVSLFPQLVAGPILRFSEMEEQLRGRTHSLAKFARGVAVFSLGLGKKVMIANPCGEVADAVFDAGAVWALDAWTGAVAYAFQIYFDFSGYSDMAIGLGLMLGFVFPRNFDAPYRAESIADFWRRWHISLSSWLRDYLYIPLGGSRRGNRRTYVNLALVMLLGGLWHGAAWNFVVWGGYHGGLLALERLLGERDPRRRWPRPLRVASTFVLVLFGWVLFRAPDLGTAMTHWARMLTLGSPTMGTAILEAVLYRPWSLGSMAFAALIVWTAPQAVDWTRRLTLPRAAACGAALWAALVLLSTQAYNPFIYFIF